MNKKIRKKIYGFLISHSLRINQLTMRRVEDAVIKVVLDSFRPLEAERILLGEELLFDPSYEESLWRINKGLKQVGAPTIHNSPDYVLRFRFPQSFNNFSRGTWDNSLPQAGEVVYDSLVRLLKGLFTIADAGAYFTLLVSSLSKHKKGLETLVPIKFSSKSGEFVEEAGKLLFLEPKIYDTEFNPVPLEESQRCILLSGEIARNQLATARVIVDSIMKEVDNRLKGPHIDQSLRLIPHTVNRSKGIMSLNDLLLYSGLKIEGTSHINLPEGGDHPVNIIGLTPMKGRRGNHKYGTIRLDHTELFLKVLSPLSNLLELSLLSINPNILYKWEKRWDRLVREETPWSLSFE